MFAKLVCLSLSSEDDQLKSVVSKRIFNYLKKDYKINNMILSDKILEDFLFLFFDIIIIDHEKYYNIVKNNPVFSVTVLKLENTSGIEKQVEDILKNEKRFGGEKDE